MARSFDEWFNEGEELYRTAMEEYRDLEAQLSALQARLGARKAELNRLAEVLRKQPVQNASAGASGLAHGGGNDRAMVTDEIPVEPLPVRTPARNFLGGPIR